MTNKNIRKAFLDLVLEGGKSKGNSNYRRGRAAEYRERKRLIKDEDCHPGEVMRTAGSHGVFDVIAINPRTRRIILVQKKSGSSKDLEAAKILETIQAYSGRYEVVACVA